MTASLVVAIASGHTIAASAVPNVAAGLYATLVVDRPSRHKSLDIALGKTMEIAVVGQVENAKTVVSRLETSPTSHGQAETRRRQTPNGRQISIPVVVADAAVDTAGPVAFYATTAALNDEVVFVQVDTTNVLVGRPIFAEMGATPVVVAAVASRPRPNGQD